MAGRLKAGQTLPPFTLPVERVKIREMVQAIGDDNPIFSSREAAAAKGYPDIPCPPTFITSAFQEFTNGFANVIIGLGLDGPRVLHGEESYEYVNEIYPGDVLTCTMRIDAIVEKKGKSGKMNLITLKTTFTNQNGETVLIAESLLIERH